MNIVPISQARSQLGQLATKVSGNSYITLTKGGKAKAALVDFNYLKKLESTTEKLLQKTFIEPKLVKYTRNFTNKEIKDWEQADKL
jgi:PHD/YefM family antitoxin component YafN of YafNO toxin-antitoxin module